MNRSDCIYLRPGELHFGSAPGRIRTLLGSCVAATLWHPQRRIGGMCHVVLPEHPEGNCDDRYADCVMRSFMEALARGAGQPKEYQVGVFGGGHMFPGIAEGKGPAIGDRNAECMQELLRRNGFHIARLEVGDYLYRHVELDLATGELEVTATSVSATNNAGGQ